MPTKIQYNVHLYTGGGGGVHGFEISASTPTYTQPWQGQSRKQAKMTQAKANMNKLCESKQNQHYSPIKKK